MWCNREMLGFSGWGVVGGNIGLEDLVFSFGLVIYFFILEMLYIFCILFFFV